MEITPDNVKLASARLAREELQAAFNIMLANAAAADCGNVVDPDVLHAEFGESIAMNLSMTRRFSPSETDMYRLILADYLRFCRMYIRESEVDDDGFDRSVYRALIRAVRNAYKRGKKEIPVI